MAAVSLPREANQSTVMPAARPTLQIRRLLRRFGFGADAVYAFTASLLAALVQVLKERRVDLAVTRVPGAIQLRLFWRIMAESLILTVAGAGLGLATARRVARGAGLWLRGVQPTPGALCPG